MLYYLTLKYNFITNHTKISLIIGNYHKYMLNKLTQSSLYFIVWISPIHRDSFRDDKGCFRIERGGAV
jgi:hypothetical protein